MTQHRFACQTITWGNDQDQRFPEMFGEIAAGGFAGVEIGFRRLEATPPAALRQQLEAYGLTLVASHIGGNLADLNQARGEWDVLSRVLDYLNALDAGLLMLSGIRGEDADRLKHELEFFEKSAAACRARGVDLLYHNHDWEFTSPLGIWEAMVEREAFRFCPDLGWIYKGGRSAVETLARIRGRIGAVHFKDFAAMEPRMNPVPLGEGVAPLREGAAWIRDHVGTPLWLISEQDEAAIPTAEMAARNGAFLRRFMESDAS
jgi:sugar phosphate isomerase/epimerase